MGCDTVAGDSTYTCPLRSEKPFDNPRDVVSRYADVLEQPVVEVVKRGGRPPPLPALQRT
ncbi:hypothetical protein SS05631_c30210 [Sinorhizobium sp. CCBAU 05631]|uniref:Uncharacterized protein n=1 Tax=Sinorhizobium americanum TaxID=194963 RepID=A0A2S3YTU9_9HYPH|nr:hypothetical protein SS05631_c30210 [Sinorhizobium sp. CCBAU 05631]POH35072.1 hypothetical protein ATY31_04810 [Sinorhizobium americanum]